MSHVPICLCHCDFLPAALSAIRGGTEIGSLDLSLGPADAQGGHVARFRDRELVKDPQRPLIVLTDEQHRGLTWLLLVPTHIFTPEVVSQAGDPGHIS